MLLTLSIKIPLSFAVRKKRKKHWFLAPLITLPAIAILHYTDCVIMDILSLL